MLQLQPVTLREAMAFVLRYHRHHKPPRGGKFAIAVSAPCPECVGHSPGGDCPCEGSGRVIVGVSIVGRPISIERDDGWTAEVTRVAVIEGNKNANSMLYAASWRAARAMGYKRCGTYILPSEGGASLRAAGWRMIGLTEDARGWNRPKRARVDTHPLEQKEIWEVSA